MCYNELMSGDESYEVMLARAQLTKQGLAQIVDKICRALAMGGRQEIVLVVKDNRVRWIRGPTPSELLEK